MAADVNDARARTDLNEWNIVEGLLKSRDERKGSNYPGSRKRENERRNEKDARKDNDR